MSNIERLVNTLKDNVDRVIEKHKNVKQHNTELQNSLEVQQSTILKLQDDVVHWKSKYETLKVANTILGSNTNKRDTKLKINALIRDIDHCISQLNQ